MKKLLLLSLFYAFCIKSMDFNTECQQSTQAIISEKIDDLKDVVYTRINKKINVSLLQGELLQILSFSNNPKFTNKDSLLYFNKLKFSKTVLSCCVFNLKQLIGFSTKICESLEKILDLETIHSPIHRNYSECSDDFTQFDMEI